MIDHAYKKNTSVFMNLCLPWGNFVIPFLSVQHSNHVLLQCYKTNLSLCHLMIAIFEELDLVLEFFFQFMFSLLTSRSL